MGYQPAPALTLGDYFERVVCIARELDRVGYGSVPRDAQSALDHLTEQMQQLANPPGQWTHNDLADSMVRFLVTSVSLLRRANGDLRAALIRWLKAAQETHGAHIQAADGTPRGVLDP